MQVVLAPARRTKNLLPFWYVDFTGRDSQDKDKTLKNVASRRVCLLFNLLIELVFNRLRQAAERREGQGSALSPARRMHKVRGTWCP
jgi:hypothetical protein